MIAVSEILAKAPDRYPIVPLGSDCFCTHQLQLRKLRYEALSFDWNCTPIQAIIYLFINDFNVFLGSRNLVYLLFTRRLLFKEDGLELEMTDNIIVPVICRKYGILFPHDFSMVGEMAYKEVSEKYRSRVTRLYELCSSRL